MLEVLSAVTGEAIAVFVEVDFAEGSVKALKQRLASRRLASHGTTTTTTSCRQLRGLDEHQTLIQDQASILHVVQLEILEFLPGTAAEHHRAIGQGQPCRK